MNLLSKIAAPSKNKMKNPKLSIITVNLEKNK
jgi:hypothetical protein